MKQNQSEKELSELKRVFEKIVFGIQEHSIILLDTLGNILTWNKGAEKIKGYKADEIIGQHVNIFYLPEDRNLKLAEKLMKEAGKKGSAFHIGKRLRKNGEIFWGRMELTAIKNDAGGIIGYTKLTCPLSSSSELGSFWFDNDGIFHIVGSKELCTEEKIEEFRLIIRSAVHDQAICCVADLRAAALSVISLSHPSAARYKAIALISDTTTDLNAELVLNLLPKEIPGKIVRNREEGTDWVKQFM